MKRAIPILISVFVLAIVGAACSSSSKSSDPTPATSPAAASNGTANAAVTVQGFAFGPNNVTIAVGGTVTWTFADGQVAHNVTFDDGNASPTMASGSWSRTFPKAGTYTYHCSIHPNMTGTVTVQ